MSNKSRKANSAQYETLVSHITFAHDAWQRNIAKARLRGLEQDSTLILDAEDVYALTSPLNHSSSLSSPAAAAASHSSSSANATIAAFSSPSHLHSAPLDDEIPAAKKRRGSGRASLSSPNVPVPFFTGCSLSLKKRTLGQILVDDATWLDEQGLAKVTCPPSARGTVKKYCSVCGFGGKYTCVECGERFCSLECRNAHKETRCLKFTQ
eukprot:ANDGO_01072.mRNA.1 hypothetical protein